MKRINYILFGVLLFIVSVQVNAASISVVTDKRTVTVGSNVKITVDVSGASGWEYCLQYDTNIFTLVSANSDTAGPCVKTGSTLLGYAKVTYTLKANKSGSSTIGIRDYSLYGDADSEGNLPLIENPKVGSVSLVSKTQQEIEASYSTNADLRNLTIDGYELEPRFDKNTLEYSLDVENDVESIIIQAVKDDAKSYLTGTGKKDLSEGINKFEIVVTAEKGNKKTYVISVNRKELNPISVEVNGKNYNVVRKSDALEAPTYYTATNVNINDTEIPAFTSEITGYTLVGLKDEEGKINLYIYDNGSYRLYKQIGNEGFIFISLNASEIIKGYESKKTININDIEVEAYSNSEDDDLVLVYGMNASTGDKNWYYYDTKEGTFQRYIAKEITNSDENYFSLVVIFALGLALAILIIVVLLIMLAKKDKQRKKLIAFIEKKIPKKDKTVNAKKEAVSSLDKAPTKEKDNDRQDKKENVSEESPKKVRKKKKIQEDEEYNPELEDLNMQFLDFIDNKKTAKKASQE